jgi:protein-S-isoprenylcysteine O-methyltransferase Ste14
MNLIGTASLSLYNSWWLSVPLILAGIFVSLFRKDVARRMSDMTGYTRKERLVTIAASLLPYPFMLLTLWVPFSDLLFCRIVGLSLAGVGLFGFFWTMSIFVRAAPAARIIGGPYRFSRNPLYVSTSFLFLGICLATTNGVLGLLLVSILFLQHAMIRVEERVCRANYKEEYEHYLSAVPRYLKFF